MEERKNQTSCSDIQNTEEMLQTSNLHFSNTEPHSRQWKMGELRSDDGDGLSDTYWHTNNITDITDISILAYLLAYMQKNIVKLR